MKNKGRAVRRHHRERLIKNRKNYWGYGNGWLEKEMPTENYNTLVNTPCVCSCWMCGNPRRRHKQITKAEHQADLDFAEQCDAVGYRISKARKFRHYF